MMYSRNLFYIHLPISSLAIPFINKEEGLIVTLPEENINKIAPVLAVAF